MTAVVNHSHALHLLEVMLATKSGCFAGSKHSTQHLPAHSPRRSCSSQSTDWALRSMGKEKWELQALFSSATNQGSKLVKVGTSAVRRIKSRRSQKQQKTRSTKSTEDLCANINTPKAPF